MMNNSGKYLIWTLLSVIGAFALGYIALNRGEQINALWIVVAAVCVYLIAYRFYGLYIAKNVLAVDPTRMTPAVRHNDGLDYVPTDKKVLFGHHFAAIAGAGPLVGPVLAAQMGYLPGVLWILVGAVLAGARMRLGADRTTTRQCTPAQEGGRTQGDEDQQINPDHSEVRSAVRESTTVLNIGTNAARLLPANGQRITTGR